MLIIKNLSLSFLQKIKIAILFTLLFINTSIQAFTLDDVLNMVVSEIIQQEYLLKNLDAFKSFMENHSFEELISSAEQSNKRSQTILFSLYYFMESRFLYTLDLPNDKSVTVTQDDLSRIKDLIKRTNSPEAFFIQGLYHIHFGDRDTGIPYLSKAKEAGHALAYLVDIVLAVKKTEGVTSKPIRKEIQKQNIEITYTTLKEMEERNIKPPGFDFFMGTVLFLKGQYTEAKKYFARELNNNLLATPTLIYIGIIHKKNRQYESAKNYLSQAIERGGDAARPYLLDIYIREGNYISAFELLHEMSLQWGKYTDIASIKASILLSYMLERGLGAPEDLIESYKWADRAKRIYSVSRNNSIPRRVDSLTGRYMLSLTFFNEDTETMTVLREHSISHPKTDELPPLFKLMKVNNKKLTRRQTEIIQMQIDSLTQTLVSLGQLQKARVISADMFESLHSPIGSRCGTAFTVH